MTVQLVSPTLTVAQVAQRAEVRPDTVRYYERVGLLPKPARTSGDHRRYDESAVERLLFIRGARRLGLRLAEIRDLLTVRDTGECPCEPAEVMIRRHVTEIDAEMARLRALRDDLTATLDRLTDPVCAEPAPATWCPTPPPSPDRREVKEMEECECCESDPSCCG